jgi:Uncharacterised protein family (UPF0175)
MTVKIAVPESLRVVLQERIPDLDRAALEGIAVRGYRDGVLSLLDIRQLFGFSSRWEAQSFLALHGAWPSLTKDDIDHELSPLSA